MNKGYNRKIKVRRKGIPFISSNHMVAMIRELQSVVNVHTKNGNNLETYVRMMAQTVNKNADVLDEVIEILNYSGK